jgi:hydroxypyruvate isomerase
VIAFSAHLSMLFTELPPLDRPAAARAAGFALVESWWPPAEDPEAWADAVAAAGVGVSCLNADGGDIAAGERGFCNLPERDASTFAAVDAALALALRVRSPNVNVLPGLRLPERAVDPQVAHAVEVYRELGSRAAAFGQTVLVEPINAVDVPAYLLPTPHDVAAFLGRVDHPNVLMLFDVYHCARGGGDPIADIATFSDLIGHLQYADCPGRGAPGTGTMSLANTVQAAEAAGYRGAIGMEYAPSGPTSEALDWYRMYQNDSE